MESKNSTTEYKKHVLESQSNPPKGIVVFFHGLGDSGEGIQDWLEHTLPDFFQPDIKYIFPTAQKNKSSVNDGMEMNSWFDVYSLLDFCKNNEDDIVQVAKEMQQLISEELKNHPTFTEKNVVVCGISQGGVVAQATVLLNATKTYGGLVVLSSWVSEAVKEFLSTIQTGKTEDDIQNKQRIYIGHGLADFLVYPENGKDVAKMLKTEQNTVIFEEFEKLGHNMLDTELENVKSFIDECLNSAQN